MTNIMLVAGDKTDKLAKFLIDRNTFDVSFQCNTIADSIGAIQSSIISVDKLVYIFQQDNMNIRSDMQLLKDLLISSGFFTVKEIVLVITDETSEVNKLGIAYFNAVMSESKFTNYSIKTIGTKKSFADIYDALLGVSHAVQFANSYKDLYRVERNSDTKTSYIPSDTSDIKIEPFSFDHLAQYADAKRNVQKIESGIIHESAAETNFTQYENPSLSTINVSSVLPKLKTELVTGAAKTGVSTWTCALAVSTLKAGKTVTVLDFTKNCDIADTFKMQNMKTNQLHMINLLKNPELSKDCVNVCTVFNESEASVKLEFLQNLFTKVEDWDGYLFIAFAIDEFEDLWRILHNDVDTIFMGITPVYSDVMQAQNFLSIYEDQADFKVFLNTQMKLMPGMEYISAKDVRSLLPFSNVGVINTIEFSTLDVPDKLYKSLLEVQV